MILLLGGTGHARRLAATLADVVPLIASLSGATKSPKAYPCETRVGGFGGAKAMGDWLTDHDIAAIIDATHPFATQISANACAAASATNTPIISLHRPPWTPNKGDDWHIFSDLESAVAALPRGARAFYATGRGGQDTIRKRADVWSALRVIDDPKSVFPGNGEYIVSRPPFDIAAEKALFSLLNITHLVAKNAGGVAARAKLDAAAALGKPVFLIDRPEAKLAPALAARDIPEWAQVQFKAHLAAKHTTDAASGA